MSRIRMIRRGCCCVVGSSDRIETKEFANAVATAAASVFPDNRPDFLARAHVTFVATDRIAELFGETDVDGLIRGFTVAAHRT